MGVLVGCARQNTLVVDLPGDRPIWIPIGTALIAQAVGKPNTRLYCA